METGAHRLSSASAMPSSRWNTSPAHNGQAVGAMLCSGEQGSAAEAAGLSPRVVAQPQGCDALNRPQAASCLASRKPPKRPAFPSPLRCQKDRYSFSMGDLVFFTCAHLHACWTARVAERTGRRHWVRLRWTHSQSSCRLCSIQPPCWHVMCSHHVPCT